MRPWIEKPNNRNRGFEPMGLAKPGKIRRLMEAGPGLASQDAASQIFERVWNWTETFSLSEPGLLAGSPDPLLSLVTTRLILPQHCATRVRHRLPWCWHHWAVIIGSNPTRGIACQDGIYLQVRPLDTRTRNRHTTGDDLGHYNLGNPQAVPLKFVSNACGIHLHKEWWNTCSWHWNFV